NFAVENRGSRVEGFESNRGRRVLRQAAFDLRPCRAGFTLMELLVVCALIAVLAALLLPAVSKSATSAQRIKCVSNLRQLGLAAQMYWDENGGHAFRY